MPVLQSRMKKLTMFYNKPTRDWNCALPIGCGKLGAMVFGKVGYERIQLNEDSVWYGGYSDRCNPDAYSNLHLIRSLLADGKISQAEDLALKSLTSLPESMHPYQTLGELYIKFDGQDGDYSGYIRSLDLESAVVSVSYSVNGTDCKREIFASYPENAIVIRLSFSKPSSFNCHMERSKFTDKCGGDDNYTYLSFNQGSEGVDAAAVIRGDCNGKLKVIGEYLCFEDTTEATLVLSAATTFREKDPLKYALEKTDAVIGKSYDEVKKEHIRDYRELFDRVSFEISGNNENTVPTDERLHNVQNGADDPVLVEQYFHFGRYLLISCSRPGSLPATLQGIWNHELTPPWESKYTININTEMNYWPAEVCNLQECHEPLFDLIERMKPHGEDAARKLYNCRGFVAHHNTDIWGDCAPQDRWIPSTYWPMGAAWLTLHMWEHYRFGQDRDFLRRAYPIMKSVALFFCDFLVEDKRGYLITSPSVSPENTYILPSGEQGCLCEGPSMDSQIIYDLFTAVIEADKIIGEDPDFAAELSQKRDRLPKPQIGRHGQIMEWVEDYDELEPGHRHISHLYALYPSWQFTTPELFKAARVTLERRIANGGGHTGWSRAWIINMWARLRDADKTYENIKLILQKSTSENLLDMHPPFQIDGNFGATAGIAESLIQSQGDEILILPALPRQWKDGYVRGLRIRGGGDVEISWKDGKLEELCITSRTEKEFRINYGGISRTVCSGEKVKF